MTDETSLLSCTCCGMAPALVTCQPSLTSSMGYAVECGCGRRSAWWVSAEKAASDWNEHLGYEEGKA